jgi:ribosomal protein L37AE/L43A
MATEKDRLGQKLRDAEKGREDQYFAQRDQELIEKARREKEKQFSDELKAAAQMTCPRCGGALHERIQHGIRTDECPACGGLWLDKGEFETLARREQEGWFGRLLRARQDERP